MTSRDNVTLPARKTNSRKSLAHVPSSRELDQENLTTDFASLAAGKRGGPFEKPGKKLRSKSIGPGGLDALADINGNRRKSLATIPPTTPRSILKPTIPPLREIPAHISTRKSSPKKVLPKSQESSASKLQNDTPVTITGAHSLPNPFEIEQRAATNETRVTLRTEEEQQAAAREREEKERQQLEKDAISRRDARRKSLANRRVSFAPEATLHTWDVVVEYGDSTTSSSGTRRASSGSGISAESPHEKDVSTISDPSEMPSTPPEQVDEDTTVVSPEHQRDAHQRRRRRSSGIPPLNFNNPDDEFLSSSPFSTDSAGDEDEDALEDDGSHSNSESGGDDDDGTTLMSLDGDTTELSVASARSASSTGSDRLDAALKAAAKQAGTRGIHYDEHGDQSEDEGVVASFAPWAQQNIAHNLESLGDQENINHFAQAAKASPLPNEAEQPEDDDMTMDVTFAVGGILPSHEGIDDDLSMDVTRALGNIMPNRPSQSSPSKRKSLASERRQSARRQSQDSGTGDETMDLTMAVGGIQPARSVSPDHLAEDITMEFTSVVGGVLSKPTSSPKSRRRSSVGRSKHRTASETLDSGLDDVTMDMTVAMGGIRPPHSVPQLDEDETTGMEMTTALGGILQSQSSDEARSRAKKVMELETDLASSPFQAEALANSALKPLAAVHTVASETGSPSYATAFKGRGIRHSTEARRSTTPKSTLSNNNTPIKKPITPSKQLTPKPSKPITPSKTSPPKNVIMRASSPKQLFKDEIRCSITPRSAKINNILTPNKLFQQDKTTGVATPSVVLTPRQRRSSGLGLDKSGLGSPRVAAILDRRRSIGEQAKSFTPCQSQNVLSTVRFEDPRIMENEIDDERAQEMAREDGKSILEREVNQAGEERDATINLKELIQSLTPRKPLKGRKSLHVGAATGLLGKRPIELDENDEDEDDGGVKRLKGHQGSPVKNVRLQGPPSKEETTGRMTRAARKSAVQEQAVASTPTVDSPVKATATTPRHQGRFKDAEANAPSVAIAAPVEKPPIDDPEVDEGTLDDRIQLQDFLNMTNIRFMELTTTKRRHTVAPRSSAKDFVSETLASTEDCVAAGAAIIPMLELFQHACTELKSYISEGRRTVREIETETFEENPPLFREYISATPDMKIFMDNQLKNVKTHARLLSKATWYDWRMTLLGTLKDGLIRSAEGMILDEEKLDEQQALIEQVLPNLARQVENLRQEESDYQLVAEELANCDPQELDSVRKRLIAADADLVAKQEMVASLQEQLQSTEAAIESGIVKKQHFLEEIRVAEKVREECRGWTSAEISSLKAKVDATEKAHGWTITGVSGTTMSLTYKREIELVFDPSSFLCSTSKVKQSRNARIDLWFIGANLELNPLPMTPEKDFFLQAIRDHIRGLPQNKTPIKKLLDSVSSSWDKASSAVNNMQLLNISYPTELAKTSDSTIAIRSALLIAPLQTKLDISLNLESKSADGGIDVQIHPMARVAYGERFNESKMVEFLTKKLGNRVEEGNAAWGEVIAELAERLLARGRK